MAKECSIESLDGRTYLIGDRCGDVLSQKNLSAKESFEMMQAFMTYGFIVSDETSDPEMYKQGDHKYYLTVRGHMVVSKGQFSRLLDDITVVGMHMLTEGVGTKPYRSGSRKFSFTCHLKDMTNWIVRRTSLCCLFRNGTHSGSTSPSLQCDACS